MPLLLARAASTPPNAKRAPRSRRMRRSGRRRQNLPGSGDVVVDVGPRCAGGGHSRRQLARVSSGYVAAHIDLMACCNSPEEARRRWRRHKAERGWRRESGEETHTAERQGVQPGGRRRAGLPPPPLLAYGKAGASSPGEAARSCHHRCSVVRAPWRRRRAWRGRRSALARRSSPARHRRRATLPGQSGAAAAGRRRQGGAGPQLG